MIDIMESPAALVLIPARYNSSRFPGKPLATLRGKSLIQRVYESVLQVGLPAAVVTDDARIENHLRELAARVVRVDDPVHCGTERIALAYQRHFTESNAPLVVNLQGDALLPGRWVRQLLQFHLDSPFDVTTLVRAGQGERDHNDPNVVKVAMGSGGRCQDFSRKALGSPQQWWHHIGLYCYGVAALQQFCSWPVSSRERAEGLEQLRGLQGGLSYGAMVVECDGPMVELNSPKDLLRAQEVLSGQ